MTSANCQKAYLCGLATAVLILCGINVFTLPQMILCKFDKMTVNQQTKKQLNTQPQDFV